MYLHDTFIDGDADSQAVGVGRESRRPCAQLPPGRRMLKSLVLRGVATFTRPAREVRRSTYLVPHRTMAVAACSSKLGKTFGVVSDPGLGGTPRHWLMHPGPLESHLNLSPNLVPLSTPAFARACALRGHAKHAGAPR